MTNFTSITQKVFSASQGDTLVDIVDWTAAVEFTPLGWGVQLRDISTGNIVNSLSFGPTFGITQSGSIPPTNSSQPIVMRSVPSYLQLELFVWQFGPFDIPKAFIRDTKVLQPITLPPDGGGGGGLVPPSQVPLAIGLGTVAVLSFVGIAYMRYGRGKRRR